jgi:N-carbamoylputrescine amidase
MDVTLSLAAIQMSMSDSRIDNVSTAERLVRQAASDGAKIILIPELFEGEYFCKEQDAQHQQRAQTIDENPTIAHFQKVCCKLV